ELFNLHQAMYFRVGCSAYAALSGPLDCAFDRCGRGPGFGPADCQRLLESLEVSDALNVFFRFLPRDGKDRAPGDIVVGFKEAGPYEAEGFIALRQSGFNVQPVPSDL